MHNGNPLTQRSWISPLTPVNTCMSRERKVYEFFYRKLSTNNA